MNVYAESNFVIEIALLQEQQESCQKIVQMGRGSDVRLVVPAFSIVEPYTTLARRHKERKRMVAVLSDEIKQLSRTSVYSETLKHGGEVTNILIKSGEEEEKRLEDTRAELMNIAEIIPLTTDVLRQATELKKTYGMSLPDAIVLASVLQHLAEKKPAKACFLNRNSRDFDDPDIVKKLQDLKCTTLFQFDSGLAFVLDQLSNEKSKSG